MWIMLLEKLPVFNAPPKLSIHWSYPDRAPTRFRKDQDKDNNLEYSEAGQYFYDHFNMHVPDWRNTRTIQWKDQSIRVFPHEFNALRHDTMSAFLFGLEGENLPTHDLVPNTEGDRKLLSAIKDEDTRFVYDAALVDGCTPPQAILVAIGRDINTDDIPPVGWYRCKQEFAQVFCMPWEMEEENDRTGNVEAYSAEAEGVECYE